MINKDIIKKNEHIIFLLLDLGLNGFNYFFHIFVAWHLIPKDYGTLNSLLSLASILFVAGVSIQLLTSKVVANKNNPISFENLISFSVKIFPVSILVLFLLTPLISDLTKGSIVSVILVVFIYFVNVFLCLLRGVFQGENRFLLINYSMYTEVFGKMIFLFIFLPMFKNIEIILLSVLIGMVSSLILAIYFNIDRIKELKLQSRGIKDTGKELMVILFSNVFLYYFTSVDMIFVNQNPYMNGGIYAVILRLSQLITFAYFSLFTLLNPWMSSKLGNKIELKKSLKKYIVLFTSLNFIIVLVYCFIIPYIVPILFGEKYIEAQNYIPYEGVAYILLAMVFFAVNVFIQLSKKTHLWVLSFGALILLICYLLYASTIMTMIIMQITIYALMLVVLSVLLNKELRRV